MPIASPSRLMCVYDTGEFPAGLQPLMRDGEHILILAEQHASKRCCSVQKSVIIERCRAILLRSDYVYAAFSQSHGDGGGHVMIHVESYHQEASPLLFSFTRSTDSRCCPRSCSIVRSCSSMIRSISSWWSW